MKLINLTGSRVKYNGRTFKDNGDIAVVENGIVNIKSKGWDVVPSFDDYDEDTFFIVRNSVFKYANEPLKKRFVDPSEVEFI